MASGIMLSVMLACLLCWHADILGQDIDLVAERIDKIDILFGRLRGCGFYKPEQVKEYLFYTLGKRQPELFVPMHAGNHGYDYKDFVDKAEADGIDQKMTWTIYKGNRFKYQQDQTKGETTLLDSSALCCI
jgi:hypothetical protein